MTPFLYALAAALGNLVGAGAVVSRARNRLSAIETSLAFGAGFMLAVVIVGVLPEVFAHGGRSQAFGILAGYLAVHAAHHVFTPHFHFGEETHEVSRVVGTTALVGLSIHAFFDGVAIASGAMVSPRLGFVLFLAVLLHKLPEGVTMASVMLAAGRGARTALAAAGVLGAATLAGALVTEVAEPLRVWGLGLAAGVTLYVAASNLVPEFQSKRTFRVHAAFFGGALALVLLGMLAGGAS